MIDIIIPVCRPDEKFYRVLKRLSKQSVKPDKLILMYTLCEADEKVPDAILDFNDIATEIHTVKKEDFSHGLTRNQGASFSDAKYILFMTQDALPKNDMLIENMKKALDSDDEISQCYARQCVDKFAPEYIRLTQLFNYPENSRKKTAGDIHELGIKTIFCSDVCCMYRREVFEKLGGFTDVLFNEDMIFARKAIDSGYAIFYCADAAVIHYHKYSCKKQRKRNFDLAVSQALHPETFSDLKSEGEGVKMVISVLKKLFAKGKIFQAVYYVFWSGNKYIGYKLGRNFRRLPKTLCKRLSDTPSYW